MLWCLILTQIIIFVIGDNTYECNATNPLHDIKKIDWMTIGHNQSNIPNVNVTISVSSQDLTLSIIASVEYVGYSRADGTYGYGTTYVMDFTSFNAHSNPISDAGICSNRISESFENIPFNKWWTYSECPYIPHQIGLVDNFLAYPKPSKYWQISMDSSQQNKHMIIYTGKFKLNELLSCNANNIHKDEKWLNISFNFYVNLVSPLAKSFDVGYYRIYQLYSAPFIIAVQKTINVFSSTGISIFTITFVAVYKQQDGIKYKLILLTESADYLHLKPLQILSSPNIAETDLDLISDNKTSNGECVAVKNNICSQLFEITNKKNIQCAKNLFSGEYIIRFSVECNPNTIGNIDQTAICQNWLNTHTNSIDMPTKLNWNDNICNTKTYLITFEGSMKFYIDNTFNADAIQTNDGLYEIGIDRVYVQINLLNYENNNEIYNIIQIKLANVWLCTTDPTNELTLDATNGNGGCFGSALIDPDGPYHIITDGTIAIGYDNIDAMIYDDIESNDVRFSFIVPSNIVRTKLYVQAQVTIDLIEIEKGIKRRIMIDITDINNKKNELDQNEMDQIRHYMDIITLQKHIKYLKHKLYEQERDIHKWSNWWLAIVIVVLFIAFIAIIFAFYAVVKAYKLKGKPFVKYSIIKYFTDDQSDDNKNDELVWREIIEDQKEKANSI